MKSICFFNNKGGVGKTFLTVSVAYALAEAGKKILLVDADPQCNLSAHYLDEKDLDAILSEENDSQSNTIWTGISPLMRNQDIRDVNVVDIEKGALAIGLIPGDVLLGDFEELLSTSWGECFKGMERAFVITTAIDRLVKNICEKHGYDLIIYDVGPNIGPLNRSIILSCDGFIMPVKPDLYSLRAITSVGKVFNTWLDDWGRIITNPKIDKFSKLKGDPHFLGYLTSLYKTGKGKEYTMPHDDYERKIASRISKNIINVIPPKNISCPNNIYKIGEVKNLHGISASAQEIGCSIQELKEYINKGVNPGYAPKIDEASLNFKKIAKDILSRI